MKRPLIFCLAILSVVAFSACGGGSHRASPLPGSSLESAADESEGMPTPQLPLTLLEHAPATDPLEMDTADAVSALPDEGILLFAENERRRILSELPLALDRERAEGGVKLLLRAETDCTLPTSLLMYLRFDPGRFNPLSVEFADDIFPRNSHLQLAMLDQYAHIPFAVAALPGVERVRVQSGTVLAVIELERAPQTVRRRISAAPAGDANTVELSLEVIGERAEVSFSERNLGDFDLNGVVEIADITQLAMHYGKGGEFVQTPVIDAGGNNQVDIADITHLAMNYGNTLSGYDLELAFTPEEGTEGDFARLENPTEPTDPTLTRPAVSLPQGWPRYEYLLPDMGYGTYEVRASAIGESLSDVGAVSAPGQAVVMNLPPAPPNTFYVSASDRTSVTLAWTMSPATDLAGYNVYITQDAAADELADFTKLNAELLESTATEYTASDLTPTTDYWFVIEAVDDKDLPSLESAVLLTKVHAFTEDLPPETPASFYVADSDTESITLAWTMSPATDLAGYNLYITQDDAADELADFTKLNAELLEPAATEYTASDLTPTTDYWFVIESVDESSQPSPEDAVLATMIHGITAIPPEAVIEIETPLEERIEWYLVSFTGENSFSPVGSDLVSFTYDWGDGTEPTIVTSSAKAKHGFKTPGIDYTVTLTVEDEYGATDRIVTTVSVEEFTGGETFNVLVVYNENSNDDIEIASYYGSPFTGRSIPPEYQVGLDLPMDEIIDRNQYESLIRDPLRSYLNTSGLKYEIYYIVTTKDVPIRVSGSGGYEGTFASVDSELCLLYEDYELAPHTTNPYYGWLSSDKNDKGNPAKSQPWQPFHFTYEGITMNYLVTRLSGWFKEDVLAMIDRGIAAENTPISDYVVIFDDANKSYDMMNDPTADESESAVDVFQRLGLSFFADTVHLDPPNQGVKIYASTLSDNGFNPDVVIGYCSHGVHSGLPSRYIIEDLDFNYLPGALFMSYESFNGQQFRGDPYTHGGHGQVADWILTGGTGAIGNVYEPYSDACGDESIIFAEYVHCGRNLAEALYKGLRRASWVEVVLGDPLCKLNVQ